MKKLLNAIMAVLLFLAPNVNYGQAPDLGTAANFVLFASIGAVTNTGLSQVTGNIGTGTPAGISGFGNVNGVMHDDDAAAGFCITDLGNLYMQLDTATPNFFISTTMGDGDTLIPGVYNISAAATMSNNLILNAQGNPNGVFIFQIDGAFSVAALTKVIMINGTQACNIFWEVEGLVSIGTGSVMRGTIVAHNAAIGLTALDTLEGRAFTYGTGGAVTTDGVLAYMPLGCGTPILTGPAAPNLLSTKYFGIFSASGYVTNTGITYVTGDVGTNVDLTTGFDSTDVTGEIFPIPNSTTAQAATDLSTVYTYLNGLPYDIQLLFPAAFGNNLVLTPHTYLLNAATSLTDSLYLNAEGNDTAVFVIQINGALSAAAFSKVILINGAESKNVYWLVQGAVTLGDSAVFNGNVIVNNAAILLDAGATSNGRLMTTTGAITINSSNVIGFTKPGAGNISGDSTVCVGSSITLSDSGSTSGGNWSSSNSRATVSSDGVVTGVAAGLDTIRYIVVDSFGIDTTTTAITVNPLPVAGIITGGNSVCMGSTLILNDIATGGTWSSSNSTATVSAGTVNPVTAGIDTIMYIVTNSCGIDTATKAITVNTVPVSAPITGGNTVCIGATLVLNDVATSGTWSSSNIDATVLTGTVTPVSPGIDTILYIITTACGADTATKTITINPLPNAGAITGGNNVCLGSALILNDVTIGGAWSSSNSRATVSAGTVNPVTAGIDTIMYIVTNSCGTDTATKTITINTSANAGTITGGNTVCMGSTLALNDVTTGGTWSSANSRATVSSGTVTPVTAGLDTIRYIVSNACGTDTATKAIIINASPGIGSITGSSYVCLGFTATLTDIAPGGVWSISNTLVSVDSGVVTGNSLGVDTIRYIITNVCGIDSAMAIITVNPLPYAGIITGDSIVCVGSVISLSDVVAGGVWSMSDTNASISGSVVTGLIAGIDTVRYVDTNLCGTDITQKAITVNPLPNAGNIIGPVVLCAGSYITLIDTTTGGTWSVSNSLASASGDTITGVSAGTDTVMYAFTNTCGIDTANYIITINPLPNAGVITGASTVCLGSSILLSVDTSGGVWSSTNSLDTINGGLFTGTIIGLDTVLYAVTNVCGIDTASKTILVITIPNAGAITGATYVCLSYTATLTDLIPNGLWSASNTFASVDSGIVTGDSLGIDTIWYTVTNSCGADTASDIITINPLPYAGVITGDSTVCVGAIITLSDAVTGGAWSLSDTNAAISDGVVIGVVAGLDTVRYVDTNLCGTDIAQKSITINPLPYAGIITSVSSMVCIGSSITLFDVTNGGIWGRSNDMTTVSGGIVTGVTSGKDTIWYMVTNMCGIDTASKIITVNPLPSVPDITTQVLSSVCSGTLYQNFGTATPPATGSYYSWSAVNAIVADISNTGQYALISFPDPGNAVVILSSYNLLTGCVTMDSSIVNVSSSLAQNPTVLYFQYHFVCLPSNLDSYQWGYDNVITLDSTLLPGQINQDYLDVSPDFTDNYYWVMTSYNGCTQKTYLTVPLAIQNINTGAATLNMYPNPANDFINVVLNSSIGSEVQLEVLNMTGQTLSTLQTANHKATVVVAEFPAGFYIINCYHDGVRITSARFVKN